VLEVACGAGQGLGYVARTARKVVGADVDAHLLNIAAAQYKGRIPLVRLDAQDLPFSAATFDTILLFEAIYYLREPARFLTECSRVLRDNGVVVVCTSNKEWIDFNPSPLSFYYYSGRELAELAKVCEFQTELFGAFADRKDSLRSHIVSILRRGGTKLKLMPKTMKGKQALKRLFLGKLVPLPSQLDPNRSVCEEITPLDGEGPFTFYKVLFAIWRKSVGKEPSSR